MGGGAMRNFEFFRKLCGEKELNSAAIVTNMWSLVTPEVGRERERQLRTGDKFFKPALDSGAQLYQHHGSSESAKSIIGHLLSHDPQPLAIQRELVDEHKHISETAAGVALLADLAIEEQDYRRQLREISREIEETIKQHDREAQEELMDSQRRVTSREETVHRSRENLLKAQEVTRVPKRPRTRLWPRWQYFFTYTFSRLPKRPNPNAHQ